MLDVPELGFEGFPPYPAVLKPAIAASTASVTTIFLIGTIPLFSHPAPDRTGATRDQVSARTSFRLKEPWAIRCLGLPKVKPYDLIRRVALKVDPPRAIPLPSAPHPLSGLRELHEAGARGWTRMWRGGEGT